jgi:predicted transcriptional regulator
MTKQQLAALLERVASLPDDAQDEVAASLAAIEAKYTGVYRVSDDERAGIERGLASLREGRLVDEDDMAAFWKRHGV